MKRFFILLIMGWGMMAFHPAEGHDPVEELFHLEEAFAAMVAEKGMAEAFAYYIAPLGVVIPDGEGVILGANNVRAAFADLPASTQLEWEPVGGAVSDDATLGYTWGNWTRRVPRGEGHHTVTYGHYLTVWKKQVNGEWRYVADIGNDAPPPSE